MKLSARAGDLATALALADPVLAAADPTIRKNATLSAVRVTAADNAVSFTLNVLDFCVTVKAAVEVVEPGEIAVALKALSALATGCASDSTIDISTTDKAMTITADRGRFRLPLVPLEDMPVVPVIEPENSIEIETAALMRLLKVTSTASTEMIRFYLCGIFLHTVDQNLVAVGTDSHQLMRVAIPAETFSTGRSCIVPLTAAVITEKLIKKTKPGTVALKRSSTLLTMETPEISFTTKLIDAVYPNYERIIPETTTNTIVVDGDRLNAAINRLGAVVAKADDPPLVALRWQTGGELELFLARQPDDGNDIVEAETTGAAQIAVSLSQVTALLEKIDGDCISLSTDGSGPLLIKRVGDDQFLALQTLCAFNFVRHETAA